MRIALFGRSGSGKGLVARHLAEKYGYQILSSGLICREVSHKIFGDDARINLNILSLKLREVDKHIWIRAALRESRPDNIVFDSLRYQSDVDFLRASGFVIWRVDCGAHLSEERLRQRGQVFEKSDLEHESEVQMEEFRWDTLINNNGVTRPELEAQVDAAVVARLP
jgi:dephospho-CoA kinase